MLPTASGGASDRTGDQDHLARLRVWVWLVALALLIGLVVFWLVRAAPEEYAKLRARASDDRYAVRAEGLAAALAQYRRHVGRNPDRLEDLVAPTGPRGYRGPYLSELPTNPSTSKPDWDCDPATGRISDPTGAWAGAAVPPSLTFSDLDLDWGALSPPMGRDLVTGAIVHYRPQRDRPVLVHYFSDNDAGLDSSLQQLEVLSREGSEVVAVLVRAPRSSGEVDSVLARLTPGFPLLDGTPEGEKLLASLGAGDTPVTILADGALNRRARVHGPVTAEALDRAMDQVWDVYEVATLGRERRPEGAPSVEPRPAPKP